MLPAKNPIITRLGKLADSGQSGVLQLSGEAGGSIYLKEGSIIYANSPLTPDLAARLEKAAEPGRQGMISSLERSWLAREATADAALELLSGKPRHARFRASEDPALSDMEGMAVTQLVAEVSRRYEIMHQLSAVLTPDSAITRNPRLRSRAIRVSDIQWAIAMRAGNHATPRTVALDLGQSVFGTTIAVFRMVTMGLLSVVDVRIGSAGEATESDRNRLAISFIRALAR